MITRRDLIKGIAAGIILYPFRNVEAALNHPRTLNMYNPHTGESLKTEYFKGGEYNADALNEIYRFMRCHHTNEVHEINTEVLDLLSNIQKKFGKDRQAQIISGYRSAEYNEYLRSKSKKVADNSLHLQGLAIDFVIPGISTKKLSALAKAYEVGGVGRYRKFVHIDSGRVRYW
jgi:uncharacterized protein YcbK (DUF882 family)